MKYCKLIPTPVYYFKEVRYDYLKQQKMEIRL